MLCLACHKELPNDMFVVEANGYVRKKCTPCRTNDLRERRSKNKLEINLEELKECKNCKVTKSKKDFYKRKANTDGLCNMCAECYKLLRKKKEPATIADELPLRCSKCLEMRPKTDFRSCKRAKSGYFSTCNMCWKPREWNSEKQKAAEKKYIQNNKEKLREKWRICGKKPNRVIRDRLNHRVAGALLSCSTRKTNKTTHYIGCSIQYLKKWFEFQFTDRIGWHNYGEWHIDHVTPCSSYDLTNESEQLECFNWRNLRPCLSIDNLTKGDKMDEGLIEAHRALAQTYLEVNPLPT